MTLRLDESSLSLMLNNREQTEAEQGESFASLPLPAPDTSRPVYPSSKRSTIDSELSQLLASSLDLKDEMDNRKRNAAFSASSLLPDLKKYRDIDNFVAENSVEETVEPEVSSNEFIDWNSQTDLLGAPFPELLDLLTAQSEQPIINASDAFPIVHANDAFTISDHIQNSNNFTKSNESIESNVQTLLNSQLLSPLAMDMLLLSGLNSIETTIAKQRRKSDPAGEKPFKCTVPGCEKSYKNSNGLKYHLNYHHNESSVKPLFCPFCPEKSWKNMNGLKYHLEHKHPEVDSESIIKLAKINELC